uniref:Meckelin n=1 Tax=Schistocephalus solidus TaxID=70667 RepID=A0A183SN86_SCHSO
LPTLYQIYPVGDTSTSSATTSAYFSSQAMAAVAFCSASYGNLTACQLLANLCTLQLQRLVNQNVRSGSACAEFINLESQRTSSRPGFASWAANMPWLYYGSQQASLVLADTSLTATYASGSTLNLYLGTYSLSGQFQGFQNASATNQLQLCKDTLAVMQAAFRFGTTYLQEVNIFFYDETDGGIPKLLPVPVLNTALLDSTNTLVNTQTSNTNWQLTRRFFLVDNVAGKTSLTDQVRYAQSIQLTITPQGTTQAGLIYPPLLTITYADLKASKYYGTGASVKVKPHTCLGIFVSFSVAYKQTSSTSSQFTENLRIAMGVLSAVGFCYAVLRTWFWARRAGVLSLDAVLVFKLLAYSASAFANAFFITIFGIAFYQLVMYKNQGIFMLTLPSDDTFLLSYLASATVLKFIDLVHIFAMQCTVDIYLIDWERPSQPSAAAQSTTSYFYPPKEHLEKGDLLSGRLPDVEIQKPTNTPVSNGVSGTGVPIWRTVLVANEWNEIQACRKTYPTFTIFVAMLILGVIGIENIASRDPFVSLSTNPLRYNSPSNPVFRLALIIVVFGFLGFFEIAFRVLVWERFFTDDLRNFADLCSVVNISVFVLAQRNFGYYIHGHSPAGRADVNLPGIVSILSSVQCDAIPRRGISPESDDHTYLMALPSGLYSSLERLLAPARNTSGAMNMSSFLSHETGQAVNRFLIGFISRDHPNGLHYRIVRRKPLENILDGEFDDTSSEGLFYIDDGNSFGDVLFYGNELSLFIFDTLLFALINHLSNSLILSGVLTWAFTTILAELRAHLDDGNNNPEESNGTGENLNNKNFHKQRRIGGISECGTRSHHAHTDTANKIAKTNCQTAAKHGESGQEPRFRIRQECGRGQLLTVCRRSQRVQAAETVRYLFIYCQFTGKVKMDIK